MPHSSFRWVGGLSNSTSQHVVALISAALFLANTGLINAADRHGTPEELNQVTWEGDSRVSVGSCWGEVQNPHNSREHPGRNFIQAKTLMRCNDLLSDTGTLTVHQKLYYRASDRYSWSLMATNTTVCNEDTVSNPDNGWVQCRTANSGFHPVMVSGVNAPCVKGSRYDYLQTSSALLVTNEGSTYSGASSKTGSNVLCRGA